MNQAVLKKTRTISLKQVTKIYDGVQEVKALDCATASFRQGEFVAIVGKSGMGLRNTFRNPARLLFAVITLALGGAIFMSAINVRTSLEQSFAQTISEYEMDSQFILSKQYDENCIRLTLSAIENIENYTITTVTYGSLVDEREGDLRNIVYDQSKQLSKISITYKEKTDCKKTCREIEETFRRSKLDILSSMTMEDAEKIYNKHLYTVASFLIGASVIVILVGIISLISISEMNVSDRMKEMGIMRSIGTNGFTIFKILLAENLLTGMLGFVISIVLAIPLSIGIGGRFGQIFLGTALPYSFSNGGAIIWLLLSLMIGGTVSFAAMKKATEQTVSKVISYE